MPEQHSISSAARPIADPGRQDAGSDGVSPADAIQFGLELVGLGDLATAGVVFRRVLDAVPDHPDALNFLAIVSYNSGDAQEAVALLTRAAEVAPGSASIRNNLANMLVETGDIAGAVLAYQAALHLDPAAYEAASNLAAILKANEQLDAAEKLLRQALVMKPEFGPAHHNLAELLARSGRMAEAIEHFWKATRYLPRDKYSPHLMAFAYFWNGEREKGIEVIKSWLEHMPENAEAKHLLAAFSGAEVPERASDEFVEVVFDRFARSFDSKLARLDYRAPQVVLAAVKELAGEPGQSLNILDAGCGTGLCGPLVRPYAKRLLGVDLSARMLDKAAQLNVYDDLHKEELTAFLARHHAVYDLIISADTLCYFGRLDGFASSAAQALVPGGALVFTVEALPATANEDFVLAASGRYAHSGAYVDRVLTAGGFALNGRRLETLRNENARPVAGYVVSARLR